LTSKLNGEESALNIPIYAERVIHILFILEEGLSLSEAPSSRNRLFIVCVAPGFDCLVFPFAPPYSVGATEGA
jgi:hypothetical protein